MEKSKTPASQNAQDLRDQQQALEWLDDIGIGFTSAAPPKRVPSPVGKRDSKKDAA